MNEILNEFHMTIKANRLRCFDGLQIINFEHFLNSIYTKLLLSIVLLFLRMY